MTDKEEGELAKEDARRICEFLDGWELDEDIDSTSYVWRGLARSAEGRQLLFRLEWNKNDRLEISGSWGMGLYQFLPYNREKTEITVSRKKSPEKIAKEIERRLLPAYERMFAKAVRHKEANDSYEKRKKDALEAIKAAIGGDAHFTSDGNKVYSYEPYNCDAEFYTDEVKLELRLPLEKAVRMLKWLKRSMIRL